MKIIRNRLIPLPGFRAINLFGILFVRKDTVIDDVLLRHEMIHSRQMKKWFYIPFYFIYILEWIFLLIKLRNPHKAYRSISFEKEAYENEKNEEYLLK